MNLDRLLMQLWMNNVPKSWYSLQKMKEGAICIEETENGWTVYTAERGLKHFAKTFASEEEACLFFWNEICHMAKIETSRKSK